MSRQATHHLLLTQVEFEYVARTVPRHATNKARDPQASKKLKKALQDFADKVVQLPLPIEGTESNPLFRLETNRQDLRMLQEIAKQEHAAIVVKIIPGYHEKIEATPQPEERARLDGYLKRAHAHAAMLVALQNKIAGRIS